MGTVFKFKDTAFKHHVTEADIYLAFDNFIYDRIMPEDPEKYLLIGFDRNANPIEVIYNHIDGGPASEDTILIFCYSSSPNSLGVSAMPKLQAAYWRQPCRPAWRYLANP
jgi:hypothetical protein